MKIPPDKPYCCCAEMGKDGSYQHNKQSARRFVSLNMDGTPTRHVIQPCRNHADCYADKSASHNWKELPKEKRRTRLAKAVTNAI